MLNKSKTTIKIIQIAIIIIITCIVVFLVNLLIIYPWKSEQIVYTEELNNAELIVVLDGEYYVRVDYAFKLIEQGYSNMLYYPSLGYKQTREHIEERLPDLEEKLSFYEGEGADSTYEEALLTKGFIQEHSIDSILLVTSPYHSYRAHWIFTKVIPEANIISATVPFEDNWFNLEIIKESEVAKRIIRSEQLKFIAYYMLYGWRIY